jgi:hypothetical protein
MSGNNRQERRGLQAQPNDPPLMRALLEEAGRKGHTLSRLAESLGVTYDRLAQWRRGEGSIATAKRSVHEKAASYLGIPTVLVLALAGYIGLAELVWPARSSLRTRVSAEVQRMRRDPFIGGFVPAELDVSPDSVRLFIVFLFHELEGGGGSDRGGWRWQTALQSAMMNAHKPADSRTSPADSPQIF